MDYRDTRFALTNVRLGGYDYFDDSQLERLMRIERGQITGDEAVAEILAEKEYHVRLDGT